MNIISTMVGMSIIGASAPVIMTMAIAPAEASKRADNFGVAETADPYKKGEDAVGDSRPSRDNFEGC